MAFLVGSHSRGGCDFFLDTDSTHRRCIQEMERKQSTLPRRELIYVRPTWGTNCRQLGCGKRSGVGLQWGGEVGFSHIYLSLELVLICSHIVQGWITTLRCCSTSFGKQFMLANANQLQFVRVPIYDVCRQTLITSKDRDVSWSKNMKINH